MQWSDHLGESGHEGQPGGDRQDLDELARAIPPRLAELFLRLAYLIPPGQQLALDTVGPGSRLVLEALRLVNRGSPGGLTELGQRLAEHLADSPPASTSGMASIGQLGPRIRRIARATPVRERGQAAASTASAEEREGHYVEYDLTPEQSDLVPRPAGAVVAAAREGHAVWLWQRSEGDTVIVLDTMDPLPSGGRPFVLANPDDEPPSTLIKRFLGLSDESNG